MAESISSSSIPECSVEVRFRIGWLVVPVRVGNVGVWSIAAIVGNVDVNVLAQVPHVVHMDITPSLSVLVVLSWDWLELDQTIRWVE